MSAEGVMDPSNDLPGQPADGSAVQPKKEADGVSTDAQSQPQVLDAGDQTKPAETDGILRFPSSMPEAPEEPDEVFDDMDRDSDLGGEPDKEELEALLEILVEAFNEVDVENTGVIATEQLGSVLDDLVEEGVISEYTEEELEMLANDMDSDRNGYIPLEEFKDVLVRRQQGYDFTEIELKEAFDVFDVNSKGEIGDRELRAVMQACCDLEVRALDGKKMIEAACETPGKTTITLEEFKAIIRWKPPTDFDDDGVGRMGSGEEAQPVPADPGEP